VVSEPKRYCVKPPGSYTGNAGEEDACREAAVEEHREPDVAASLAALPEYLDNDRTNDARDDSEWNRRRAGQQRQSDPGERNVAQPVTEQTQPALHDVGADSRSDQPGEECSDEGALHEGVGQDFDHGSMAPPSSCSRSS
jgi:hypothetical protein